ncbi:hypothetical protein AB0I94_36360 [Streptomyces sp. NPDC050147]|uniref:hypothetical protein n=1 Tax=Streptomyces sp. NPDC050147 TaxID=3155513 RepID=UPI0034302B98
MGKASRGKRERSREAAGQWTAAEAARKAHRARTDTLRLLAGNSLVHTLVASNLNNVLGEMTAVLMNSDAPEGSWHEAALAIVLGKQGYKPPWPTGPGPAATWQIKQTMKLLRSAEVFVVSPAAHAAVMAAAATLDPADVSSLHRDQDIVVPSGLLVLPEPVVVINRAGSLSDTAAFGWDFTTQHQILPTARYPGVRVTTFMDRDGPVQPEHWRQIVSHARALGSPMPRLVLDGMYGMRGDGCLAKESDEYRAQISEQHREIQNALNSAAQWRAEPVAEMGEWNGERINDVHDDFACRYMFAFWRLAAQGITTPLTSTAGAVPHGPTAPGEPVDPDVRIIRLSKQVTRSDERADASSGKATRSYHHRWPVRMHKVRQWYPKSQEHRVIWRGPYIKGPAEAPLMLGEKAYVVDS